MVLSNKVRLGDCSMNSASVNLLYRARVTSLDIVTSPMSKVQTWCLCLLWVRAFQNGNGVPPSPFLSTALPILGIGRAF